MKWKVLRGKRIVFFIDGLNIFRKEFGVKFEDIVEVFSEIGDIRVVKVIFN